MKRLSRTFLSALFITLTATSVVHAQTDEDKSTARATATAGQKAHAKGDHEKSLKLFLKAESLVHAPTHLLYIARSQVELGQLVEAQETYKKLTYEKLSEGAPEAFRGAQEAARTELATLEPRIPHLTAELSENDVSEFDLIVDGVVRQGVEGVPQPINPGEHTVSVRTEGWASDEVALNLAEGASESATFELHRVETTETSSSTSVDTAPSDNSGRKIATYSALGVGGIGVAAGVVLAIVSGGKRSEADGLCEGTVCPLSEQENIEER